MIFCKICNCKIPYKNKQCPSCENNEMVIINEEQEYYLYNDYELFRDIDNMKDVHIDEYEGIKDNFEDWEIDYEPIMGYELIKKISEYNLENL